MIHVIRSWLPGGQPWITCALVCDGCGCYGSGPIGSDRPENMSILAAKLRVHATLHRRWCRRRTLEPDEHGACTVPHRVDLCPDCAAATASRPWPA